MAWTTVTIIALVCALPLAAMGGWYLKASLTPAPIVTTVEIPAAVGDMPVAQVVKLQPRRRDEGYTGGQVLVLKDFKTGLGCYWTGHEYATTKLNAAAFSDAIERGQAVMLVPPK